MQIKYDEHDVVRTVEDMESDFAVVPKNTHGTVVSVHKEAYDVEFPTLQGMPVITAMESELELVTRCG